ncbi:MAG: septum formation initiator [Chlorobi bacterium]|nr:septum formation initiator [Chlorobiota bacterium]
MKDNAKKIWYYITKFKYLIAFTAFAVWITFIDQTNLRFKSELKQEIEYLKNKKEYYREEILKNEKYYKDLTTNPDAKERLAREEYYMHKDNEEVFLIKDKTE